MGEIDRGIPEVKRNNLGCIEIITGPMFCGKSEELQRRLRRAVIAKQKIQVFKPHIDDRYSIDKITSHSGYEFPATPVDGVQEMDELIEVDTTVVAIDEVQFFKDEIIQFVNKLVNQGKRVIVAGLDTDFRFEPFGSMPILMAMAEVLDKYSAICVECGEPATRTQRLVDGEPADYSDPTVVIGADEMYEARCRKHHDIPGKLKTNRKDKNE